MRKRTDGVLVSGKTAMTIDRRVQRTRTALYDALVALIRERDYETITVEDVLRRADVGRSTFYAHFTCKDDLLERSLERLRRLLATATEASLRDDGVTDAARVLFEHVAEYADVRAKLAGSRGAAVLDAAIEDVLADYLRKTLPPASAADGVPRELRIRHLISTFAAVLRWWGEHAAGVTPAQAFAYYRLLVLDGLPATACQPFLRAAG